MIQFYHIYFLCCAKQETEPDFEHFYVTRRRLDQDRFLTKIWFHFTRNSFGQWALSLSLSLSLALSLLSHSLRPHTLSSLASSALSLSLSLSVHLHRPNEPDQGALTNGPLNQI